MSFIFNLCAHGLVCVWRSPLTPDLEHGTIVIVDASSSRKDVATVEVLIICVLL